MNEKLDKTYEDNKLLKEEIDQLKSGVLEAVSEPKVVNNYTQLYHNQMQMQWLLMILLQIVMSLTM